MSSQPAHDWYPDDGDEPGQGPGQQAKPGAPRWTEASAYWETLTEEDYGPRYGFVGDVPAAGPLRRIGALAIDAFVTAYIPFLLLQLLGVGGGTIGVVILVLAGLHATVYRPDYGQTLGKQLLRIQAVRTIRSPRGRQAIVNPGPVRNVVRAWLHFLDLSLLVISVPLIFITPKHRTLADFLTKTVVIRPPSIEPLPDAPKGSTSVH